MEPRERLIVALDVPDATAAFKLVSRLEGVAGMLKVGSQLFTAAGPAFVRELVKRGEQVFLDLKYHDIPNTVAAAVAAACDLGVSLLDVHILGGQAVLEAAVAARPKGAATRLLGITILTSHSDATLAEIGLDGPVPQAVSRLAALAKTSGLDGVVASPHEVAGIRSSLGDAFLVVTPGIRPAGSDAFDQVRLATPAAALRAGASHLVVGRPITEAPDPAAAARAILAEMAAA
jgi:orotidine-5'-phosphate decarboxylase